MPFSQFLAEAVLNWHKGSVFPVLPTSPSAGNTYLSLHTADPGATGTGSDVTATVIGASRPVVSAASWGSPVVSTLSGGGFQMANTAAVTLSNSAINASPVTVTYFGLWTAATGGNFLNYGLLSPAVTIVNADVVRFGVGQLVLRVL